jgi:hypothetical protein
MSLAEIRQILFFGSVRRQLTHERPRNFGSLAVVVVNEKTARRSPAVVSCSDYFDAGFVVSIAAHRQRLHYADGH